MNTMEIDDHLDSWSVKLSFLYQMPVMHAMNEINIDPIPNYQRAAALVANRRWQIILMGTTTLIAYHQCGQSKPGLINKKHFEPPLSCPAVILSAPLHTSLVEYLFQWHTDGSSSAMQIMLVQADCGWSAVLHWHCHSQTFCSDGSTAQSS